MARLEVDPPSCLNTPTTRGALPGPRPDGRTRRVARLSARLRSQVSTVIACNAKRQRNGVAELVRRSDAETESARPVLMATSSSVLGDDEAVPVLQSFALRVEALPSWLTDSASGWAHSMRGSRGVR